MNENEIREIVKNTIIASKSEMTLNLAERVADAVIAEAQRMGIKVVVALSDAAGNPISISLKPILTKSLKNSSFSSRLIGIIRDWFPSLRSTEHHTGGFEI